MNDNLSEGSSYVYVTCSSCASDNEGNGRNHELNLNKKFKTFASREEHLDEAMSLSSSYLHLSGHEIAETCEGSMSYVSVGGTDTLTDTASGYVSDDENQDTDFDDSSKSEMKCFSCLLDGIEAEATHMCQTCKLGRRLICHICLKQHNKFCEEHDVISLSVKYEQQTEPTSNPSVNKNTKHDLTENSFDPAVPHEATSIHFPKTEFANHKCNMKDSCKYMCHRAVTGDQTKEQEYQQTISTKQSAIPQTYSTKSWSKYLISYNKPNGRHKYRNSTNAIGNSDVACPIALSAKDLSATSYKNQRKQYHFQKKAQLEKEEANSQTLTTDPRCELIVEFNNLKGGQRHLLEATELSELEDQPELQNNNRFNTSENQSTIPAPVSKETSFPRFCDNTSDSRVRILKYVIDRCLLYVINFFICLFTTFLQYLTATLLQPARKIINLAFHSTSHIYIEGTRTVETQSINFSGQTSERSDLRNDVRLQHTVATLDKRLDTAERPGLTLGRRKISQRIILSSTPAKFSTLTTMSDLVVYGNEIIQKRFFKQYADAVPGRKNIKNLYSTFTSDTTLSGTCCLETKKTTLPTSYSSKVLMQYYPSVSQMSHSLCLSLSVNEKSISHQNAHVPHMYDVYGQRSSQNVYGIPMSVLYSSLPNRQKSGSRYEKCEVTKHRLNISRKLHSSKAMSENSFHRGINLRQHDHVIEKEDEDDSKNLRCLLLGRTVHHDPYLFDDNRVDGRKIANESKRTRLTSDLHAMYFYQTLSVDGKRNKQHEYHNH